MEPITGKSVMSQADVDKIIKMLESRGGSVSIQDPRVTQVQTWLIGLIGIGIIVALGWLASSVDSLNRSFAGLSVWKEYTDQRISNLERKQ